jgi:hypothetical protein
MMNVLTVAAAAALVVIAYHRLRRVAPETGAAGLRAVRDLADVILVCVRAVEGVVEILARHGRLTSGPAHRWAYSTAHDTRYHPGDDDGYDPGDDAGYEDDYEPDDEPR